MALFNVPKVSESVETKYTKKIQIPQYLPSDKKPTMSQMYDTGKYSQLLRSINNSSVTDEEKQFLRLAATRHIVFTYSKIADYYAHADAEMQSLMEQSALVIIDIDDAIANGYVKLSENIKRILKESGELAT